MNGVKIRFSDMSAIIQSPLNFFLEEELSKSLVSLIVIITKISCMKMQISQERNNTMVSLNCLMILKHVWNYNNIVIWRAFKGNMYTFGTKRKSWYS